MKTDPNLSFVYILLFPNGKRYVGQTIQTIEERMSQHFFGVRNGSRLPIHRAMRKYGEDHVKIEKVYSFKCTQIYLDLIEDRTITAFNALVPNGYNVKRGGSPGAHSEATKLKMAKAHKGKHHSEETKAKISVAKMGSTGTMTGRHHSKETRERMSLAQRGHPSSLKGIPRSEEVRARISAAHKGMRHSEETKAKMSAIRKGRPSPMKGRPRSEMVRAKISATLRKRIQLTNREVKCRENSTL